MTTIIPLPTQHEKQPELDYAWLDRQLGKVKTTVFLGKNAAFLAHLMCALRFTWDRSVPTACTNGIEIRWGPAFFAKCSPKGRSFVLLHELWHVALLHMLRRGNRDPRIWNIACDYFINNMLDDEGYDLSPQALGGIQVYMDHLFDGLSVEEIYDQLIVEGLEPEPDFVIDLIEPGDGNSDDANADGHTIINAVVGATHAAGLSGNGAGSVPGEVETILKRFLAPKLPWKQLLYNFFNEMQSQDYTWARPSRRYSDMYLPSLAEDEGRLEHLIYYLDVSGSVSDDEVVRFNSEVKYIKETFNPQKLTLVQFDHQIQDEKVFYEDDPFDELVVIGRGGTNLVPVRRHIIDNKPTAAVVFSDLIVDPMEPLPAGLNVPLIWVAVNNHDAKVNFGKLIHIRE